MPTISKNDQTDIGDAMSYKIATFALFLLCTPPIIIALRFLDDASTSDSVCDTLSDIYRAVLHVTVDSSVPAPSF